MLRMFSLIVLVLLYVAAGVNHFINPGFYESIIPPYLPQARALVAISGIAEVVLGVLLIPPRTRLWSGRMIAVMLVLFIPVHVYMLQQAYHVPGYRTTVQAAWIRLLLQPLLVAWVLWQGGGRGVRSRGSFKGSF